MMEIVFFNGGFNSSSDGVCFERPARSRYQRSVPAPTYRRRARSFNWHANHSNFCPHNFVVISANSHSITTDREHFDLCYMKLPHPSEGNIYIITFVILLKIFINICGNFINVGCVESKCGTRLYVSGSAWLSRIYAWIISFVRSYLRYNFIVILTNEGLARSDEFYHNY